MNKNILGPLLGVLTGWAVLMLLEWINGYFYPLPDSVDPTNYEQLKAYIDTIPFNALLGILIAYAGASMAAGFVTARIASSNPLQRALIPGGVLLLGGIMNLMFIPHPIWFATVSLLLFLPYAWAGAVLGVKTS